MATSSASNPSPASRKETDRLEQKGWLNSLLARPEIGPIGVMLLLFGNLSKSKIFTGSWCQLNAACVVSTGLAPELALYSKMTAKV